MNNQLQELLAELEQFGNGNDSATTERSRKMLNITRDTGEFLAVLVRATVARRVLEIGTSNGYSTLWLASAAQAIGGSVTTVEFSDYKIALATKTFARSGLASFIASIQDDAGRVLERTADSAFDFIFLDSERPEYPGWWAEFKTSASPWRSARRGQRCFSPAGNGTVRRSRPSRSDLHNQSRSRGQWRIHGSQSRHVMVGKIKPLT